jgi:hypothetical protein
VSVKGSGTTGITSASEEADGEGADDGILLTPLARLTLASHITESKSAEKPW